MSITLNKILVATTLTICATQTAFANSEQTMEITERNEAQFADNLFNEGMSVLEVKRLSKTEMLETEGAFGPWGAIGGGLIGGVGNVGYQLGRSNGWSWGGFGYAVGTGALTGFSGGAAAWYVVPRAAFFTGFGAGRMGW